MEEIIKLPIDKTSPIVRGDTFKGITIGITEDNIAINLTGATIRIQLYPKSTSNPILLLQTGVGITITDPINGLFQLDEISRLNWAVDVYLGDIEITLSNNERITYCKIEIAVSDDKTK